MFFLIRNFKRQKSKLEKVKLNFCNVDGNINADADANISNGSGKLQLIRYKKSGTEN